MFTAWENKIAEFDDFVLLGGRLLLAWLFVHEGVTLTANFDAAAASMAKMGVPAPLLIVTTALQLAAGAAITLGWRARLAATGLGLFCVATAILFHTNFGSRNELLHFEKDLAIAGGMFVLMVRGAGSWSLDGFFLARRDADGNWTATPDAGATADFHLAEKLEPLAEGARRSS
jgi:putative oxidoreductase